MLNIVFIIANIGFIFSTACIDATHILKQEYILDHRFRFFQRFWFYYIIVVICPMLGIASILAYVAFFDSALNKMIGQPLFYLGEKAEWDIFWTQHKILYVIVKIVALAGTILIFSLYSPHISL